jgi:hypothetical protein
MASAIGNGFRACPIARPGLRSSQLRRHFNDLEYLIIDLIQRREDRFPNGVPCGRKEIAHVGRVVRHSGGRSRPAGLRHGNDFARQADGRVERTALRAAYSFGSRQQAFAAIDPHTRVGFAAVGEGSGEDLGKNLGKDLGKDLGQRRQDRQSPAVPRSD